MKGGGCSGSIVKPTLAHLERYILFWGDCGERKHHQGITAEQQVINHCNKSCCCRLCLFADRQKTCPTKWGPDSRHQSFHLLTGFNGCKPTIMGVCCKCSVLEETVTVSAEPVNNLSCDFSKMRILMDDTWFYSTTRLCKEAKMCGFSSRASSIVSHHPGSRGVTLSPNVTAFIPSRESGHDGLINISM